MNSNRSLLNSIRQHCLSGQFQEAVELCLEGLAETPDSTELHFLLAMCDERLGRVDDALERFERVAREDRNHVQARFALGRLLTSRGRVTDARQYLNACLELDPGYAPARTIRARLDMIDGRPAEAISGLKTALRGEPQHLPALISLAEILLAQGDAESAHEYASQALQVSPDDGAAQLVMGRVFTARNMFAFAERCLANAADSDPSNPHVHVATGELLQRMNRHGEAVERFERARRAGLESRSVLRGLAVSLGRSGRLPEAGRVFAGFVPTAADRELVLDLAELHEVNNDASALSELAQRGSELPEDVRRWLDVVVQKLDGDLDQAVALADSLCEAEDIEVQARARLLSARAKLGEGDRSASVSALSPLVREPRLRSSVIWEIAGLLREADSADQADHCLEQLVGRKELDEQTRARTQGMRVDLLDQAGRFNEAEALLDRAAWRTPYLGEPAYRSVVADPDESLAAILAHDWPDVQAVAGPLEVLPVFVSGWPYAGRDLVMAALSRLDAVGVLTLSDWPQRKRHLGLPLNPQRFDQEDADRLHLMRRRYARYLPSGKRPVESAVVQPLDWVQLAQLFPGAMVIHTEATEKYLELQWRLSGYRQVGEMMKAWRREQVLLSRLRSILPLRYIDVSLEGLLTDTEKALTELCEAMGLEYHSAMQQAASSMVANRGYRSPDHWKHYSA